jgi:hypothetical protein
VGARHQPTGDIRRLILHECQQVGTPEASFPLATHPETGEAARVGPSAERGLAYLEELRCLLDVEQ